MPDAELFTIQAVPLTQSVRQIASRSRVGVNCVGCGEEVINEREGWGWTAARCVLPVRGRGITRP